jgi:iron complex outermembrane receptor protein
MDVQIMSSRRTLSGSTVGAAAIANFTARVPLGPRMTLATTVHNLFNEAYADPGSAEHRQDAITQDGRTVRVGLEWSFGRRP